MPVPMMNIVNGGAHADNNVDMQEFMILPVGAESFSEALRWGVEVFHTLKGVLRAGGCRRQWATRAALRPTCHPMRRPSKSSCSRSKRRAIGQGTTFGWGSTRRARSSTRMGATISPRRTSTSHPQSSSTILRSGSIDTRSSRSKTPWPRTTGTVGNSSPTSSKRVQLVGDDLFVTNTTILRQGIDKGVANSILIKLNQIGTLTETLAAITMADAAGYTSVVSHRSGETEDTTIADLAVSTAATQIKTGSLCRSDRVAKYNRLLLIEHELGSAAEYAGRRAFSFDRTPRP